MVPAQFEFNSFAGDQLTHLLRANRQEIAPSKFPLDSILKDQNK